MYSTQWLRVSIPKKNPYTGLEFFYYIKRGKEEQMTSLEQRICEVEKNQFNFIEKDGRD